MNKTNLEKFFTGEIKNGKKVLVRELSKTEFDEWLNTEVSGWTIVEETDTYVEFSAEDIDFMYRIYI